MSAQVEMLKIDKTILYDLLMEEDDGTENFSLRKSMSSLRAKKKAHGNEIEGDKEDKDDGKEDKGKDVDSDDQHFSAKIKRLLHKTDDEGKSKVVFVSIS